MLLQIGAAITNKGNRYYKIGQLLQIGAKCITEKYAGYTNDLNLHQPKAYIFSFRVNKDLLVLMKRSNKHTNLHSVSINKILIKEFITVEVSQNLNLM